MQDSLQLSHWADGVGLEERARQLAAVLRASYSAEGTCAWLRRDRVLLSVNPGRPLPGLHGDRSMTELLQLAVWRTHAQRGEESPAHPFALGEAAAQRAADGGKACVCVVGESGSGKSEVAKLVLLHLLALPPNGMHTYADPDAKAIRAGASSHRAISVAVVLSRGILESFTHAATPANPNSSRLVLATQLWFSPGGFLVGARYQMTLLQAMRAGRPPPRAHSNFHVLHAAAHSASAEELGGVVPSELRLLGGGGAGAGRDGNDRGGGPPSARGRRFDELSAALAALGMGATSVRRLREVLLGMLLLGQLDTRHLSRIGANGEPSPAASVAEARMKRRCEELIGDGCDVRDLIPSAVPSGGGGQPSAYLAAFTADEREHMRARLISRAYELFVFGLVQWVNGTLALVAAQSLTDEWAGGSGGGGAPRPTTGVASHGSVTLIDSPGLEALDTAPLGLSSAVSSAGSYATLISNYTAERLRLALLRVLLPPTDTALKEDEGLAEALNGADASSNGGYDSGLTEGMKSLFTALHTASEGPSTEVAEAARVFANSLPPGLASALPAAQPTASARARNGAHPPSAMPSAKFTVAHYAGRVTYDASQMPLCAPAGQASHGLHQHELEASVLLATIQRQIHTILEPPRPAAAAARAGSKAQAAPQPGPGPPPPPPPPGVPHGGKSCVAPEEVVAAVGSIADALEETDTDVSFILCLRPSAREALAELPPHRANGVANDLDALATHWDEECVARQLESFRVLEGVLSAARPAVSCRLPYEALAALLGDGRGGGAGRAGVRGETIRNGAIADLSVPHSMLLLLLACGAPPLAIALGDEWAALGDGAPARRARRLLLHGKPARVRSLVEQCKQAQHEPIAAPPIRGRRGGSGAKGLPPNTLLEALLQQVDALAGDEGEIAFTVKGTTAPGWATTPWPHPVLFTRDTPACERRWGRAFVRLSADAPDGSLEALELSDAQPGVEPLQAVQLAAAAPAQWALRRRVLARLAEAAPPPRLASVAMRGVGLGDAERQLLLRLVRHHPRLATLDIRHNALSPPAVEELGRLVSECNRERLAAGIAAPLTLLCEPMLARPALAGEAGGHQPRFGSAQHWGTRALVYATFALLAALTVADVRSLQGKLPHSPAERLWKGSKGLQWPAMPPPPPPPPPLPPRRSQPSPFTALDVHSSLPPRRSQPSPFTALDVHSSLPPRRSQPSPQPHPPHRPRRRPRPICPCPRGWPRSS